MGVFLAALEEEIKALLWLSSLSGVYGVSFISFSSLFGGSCGVFS